MTMDNTERQRRWRERRRLELMNGVTEHMSEPGAKALAQSIREYWAEQGYAVTTFVVPVSVPRSAKTRNVEVCWIVRSDIINGVPLRKAKAA